MTTVKAVGEAMILVARAQSLLRETRDARALEQAGLLEDRQYALSVLLREASGK